MSFMSLWMGFNGWMESVTGADHDAAMITAIAENRRATDAYEELMQDDDFQRRVMAFSQLWPVLNVRDVRQKLGRDAFWAQDRDELFDRRRRVGVRMQPVGWTDGDVPTWPQLLRTIYCVRCNLFHGAKSPQHGRDRDLVRRSGRILRMFIERGRCFEWTD
ncbi:MULTISPECIES: hypothetical protein [Sphingomonas]|jgi:hypothetical protein|nr:MULTISPECIES: hypothetical protein [Sphingomonas]